MKSTLHIIWAIARNTYKESIRDKLLYGILLVAALLTGASFFLATISLDQNHRILQNIGFASIQLFTIFIVVFVATTSLHKDFERRALYVLFAKPISRGQYIVGKYIGFILLAVTTLLILGGLFGAVSYSIDPTIVAPLLINLWYIFLEVALLAALAILFASFTASLNAALYTLAIFLIGHSLGTLREFTLKNSPVFVQKVIAACYYLLPNLEKFDVRRTLLYGLSLPTSQVLGSIGYGLVYTFLVLVLAVYVTNRREV